MFLSSGMFRRPHRLVDVYACKERGAFIFKVKQSKKNYD